MLLTEFVDFYASQTAPDGWKNSVRHNLSLNKCFEKVENKMSGSSRKGCLWALNPAKIDKMEEEMQKWKRKDLPAIRRSMANPGLQISDFYYQCYTAKHAFLTQSFCLVSSQNVEKFANQEAKTLSCFQK